MSTEQQQWPRVRSGMSLDERRAARAGILNILIRKAHRDAAVTQRSITCADRPIEDHDSCVGEQPGNLGCLCECHDPKEQAR